MQQTALDRWLRKKFIYITRIYCNTLPGEIPPGLRVEEAPEESGGRYLYKLTACSERVVNQVADAMRMDNITYTSRVEDRKVWYGRWLNDPRKSFTYRMAWLGFALAGLAFSVLGGPQKLWSLMDDQPEEEVVEAAPAQTKIYHKSDTLLEIDRR